MQREKKEYIKNIIFGLISLIVGAISFIILYGTKILDFENIDWLLRGGDLTQHYLGWVFYRKAAWTFPIGMTDQLAYPSYTSVIYTDSIPLFAVAFKIISPILPDKFQYFGLWGIVSFSLQAFVAYLICNELEIGKVNSLIASLFFVFSPMVNMKMYKHSSLAGHWVILLAIYIFIRHKKDYKNIAKSSVLWAFMALLISSIHMYYLPMCGVFLAGYVISSFWIDKKSDRKLNIKYLYPLFWFLAVLFGNTYILGGFSSDSDFSADGLGECSFNLNGFFSPKGYSRWLPSLPKCFDLQYEGFAYLGMGIIFLLGLGIITMTISCIKVKKREPFKSIKNVVCIYSFMYVLMSMVLIILAASPVVTFGDRIIFEYPDIDLIIKCWSIFRSSGRLIWPVVYLIFIGIIYLNCKNDLFKNKKYIIKIILVFAVGIQLFDMEAKLKSTYEDFRQEHCADIIFDNKLWEDLSQNKKLENVIWVSNDYENNEILDLAIWAYRNNCTMNRFYFARGIDVRENTKHSMQNLNDKSVYVFKNSDTDLMAQYELNYYSDGIYTVGLTYELRAN